MTAASLTPALMVGAQAAEAEQDTVSQNPNRFRAGAQFLFNVSADFTHRTTPASGVFANGFINQDGLPLYSVAGQTRDWGVTSVNGPVGATYPNGTTLSLQQYVSPVPNAVVSQNSDPLYGFQVGYGRVLGEMEMGKMRVKVGLDLGFGTAPFNIQNRTSFSGIGAVANNYTMIGTPIVQGAAPFSNLPFSEANINNGVDNVNAVNFTPVAGGGTVNGTASEYGKIDGEYYGFKIGPFFEFPITPALALELRGGACITMADAKFSYQETTTVGARNVTTSGESSSSQWLGGFFFEAQASLALSRNWGLFVAGGYQNAGNTDLDAGDKSVRLKLDSVISLTTGIKFSF